MTTTQTAIVSFVVGVLAATIPAALALIGQRGQRQHEAAMAEESRSHDLALARADRRYADLRVVYVDLMRFIIEEVERLRRTKPVFGPAPEPPPGIEEIAAFDLQARVYAYASEPTKEELERFLLLRNRFAAAVAYLDDLQSDLRSGARVPGEESPSKLWRELEQLRQDAIASMERMRILVRDELSS